MGANDMRALRFDNTGSLDCLAVAKVDRPRVQPGEMLVRAQAATINPSDVKKGYGNDSRQNGP
jgi:NADPH:quinone reductase-like Zn-dependent oxidoreductase